MLKGARFSPLVFGVLVIAVFLVYLNWPQPEQQQQRRGGATPVVTENVNMQPFEVAIEALGTAKANEAVSLTAQKSAIVTDIAFDDGDLVQQGQVLLNLDNREELAKVRELKINLDEAKRQERRLVDLAKENVTSQQILEEQQAKVKALKAQLDVANAQLAQLQVVAPFDGRLGIRQVSRGALVRPGDLITTLDDVSQVKVDFSIAENHLPSVSEGLQVFAESIAYPEQTFAGTISSIDSRIDPVTRSVQVRAIIDNAEYKLHPGMLLQITLQKKVMNTLVVPEQALVPIQDRQYVYVLNGDKVMQRQVELGERKPGIAEVKSGLQSGEQIVVEGTLRLRDGATVRVLNAEGTEVAKNAAL